MFAKTLMLLGLVSKQRKIYTYTCYWKGLWWEKRPGGDPGEEVYTQVFPVSHRCRRPCSVYTEPILLLSPSVNSHCITGRAPESICLCYILSSRRISRQRVSGKLLNQGDSCKHSAKPEAVSDHKLPPRSHRLQEAPATSKTTIFTPEKQDFLEDAGRLTSLSESLSAVIFICCIILSFTLQSATA